MIKKDTPGDTLERVRACESAHGVEEKGERLASSSGIMRPGKSWAPLAATVLATALLLQPIHADGKNLRIWGSVRGRFSINCRIFHEQKIRSNYVGYIGSLATFSSNKSSFEVIPFCFAR